MEASPLRRGRPIPLLTLTLDERRRLQQWTSGTDLSQSLAQRARAILACAEGKTNTAVSSEIGASQLTVGKWRRWFLARRLAGLRQDRRGRPVRPRAAPASAQRVAAAGERLAVTYVISGM